jgi:hypothetical protein
MSITDFTEISKDEAIAAVRRDSWTQYRSELATCGHPGCEDHPGGVERIHSLLGGIGADWDVTHVVEFIESAQRCGWLKGSFLGHQLVVLGADGRRVRFEAKKP